MQQQIAAHDWRCSSLQRIIVEMQQLLVAAHSDQNPVVVWPGVCHFRYPVQLIQLASHPTTHPFNPCFYPHCTFSPTPVPVTKSYLPRRENPSPNDDRRVDERGVGGGPLLIPSTTTTRKAQKISSFHLH
jgi:hypothetical protein